MSGPKGLLDIGFIDKGKFNRPGVSEYSKRFSTPVTTPYVDGLTSAILRSQGYHVDGVIDPANLYDPEQLYDGLARYAKAQPGRKDEFQFLEAYNFVYSIFAKPKDEDYLKVLDDIDMLDALKMDKSAGIGLLGSKGANIVIGLRREQMVKKGQKAPNPCQAFARTQRGGKTRLVWGYPLEMTMMEARFARPLIDVFKKGTTPMTIGVPKYAVAAKISCNIKEKGNVYSLDFSKFDSSISEDLIRCAFSILKTWFSPEDRLEGAWGKIVNYFIYTPIVMPNGKLYHGKAKGVPSGSFFTQLVDSIVNLLAIKYATNVQNVDLAAGDILVLGDDSIFGTRKNLSMDKLKDDLAELGLTVNLEKSGINTYHYLGSYWRFGTPHNTRDEIAKRILCPERYRYHGRKSLSDKLDLAVELLENMTANWVEAETFVWRQHSAWAALAEAKHDSPEEALCGWEKARFSQGLSVRKSLPWLRILL
uniref:RdRp n=1 Tax=Hubei partiti-like virus 53 TaxID=1923062 RepID=A0A1L3KLM6_9VIRU|nr:RdRp [Hubei partiti-like virus 53]